MKDLSVFFDKDKFIRVNTRLGNSQNLNYDEKFPILISRKSNFLYFQFEQIHRDTGNGSVDRIKEESFESLTSI